MTTKIRFGKFEGSYADSDRDADLYINGERVGFLTAVIDDHGNYCGHEYVVGSYDADFAWQGKEHRISVWTFGARNGHARPKRIRTAAEAKRIMKAKILEAVQGA